MARRRRELPPNWRVYVRRRGWGEYRVMVWAGLLLGLLLLQAMQLLPVRTPEPSSLSSLPIVRTSPVPPVDPYRESRRSRAILEAQSGAPTDGAVGGTPGGGTTASARTAAQRVSGPVRVIDGDTFVYGAIRVRIADIDTPEVNGRCAHETRLAARATQRMHALLAAGPFELHALGNGRDLDQYGRKLRIVTRGGRSLGDVLVAEGLARTWTGRREPWC